MSSGSLAAWFDDALAREWDERLAQVDPKLRSFSVAKCVSGCLDGKAYSQRLDVFARAFEDMPGTYPYKCKLFAAALGPENSEETGMFSHFYWILPLSRFVQHYGVDYLPESLELISEMTKRSTGEYAIRPFAARYPAEVLEQCHVWAIAENFHLRRLASEGLRPHLPWASKLSVYLSEPTPVFELLDLLVEDDVRFVRRSVANHATDYLRIAPELIKNHVESWRKLDSANAADVVKRFDRRLAKRGI